MATDVFAAEFEPLMGQLRAKARTFTMCDADAEDLHQETMLKVWQKISQYKPNSNPYGWALRIMRNLAIDRARAAGRGLTEELTPTFDDDAVPYAAGDPTADEALDNLSDEVTEALGELSDDFLAALYLTDVVGMSNAQTAEFLGEKRGTINSRQNRARKQVKAKLEATPL